MSEYKTIALGDLGQITTGKTPPSGNSSYFGGGIPFVTPSDMDGERYILRTGRSLTQEGLRSVSKRILPAGSILVSCIGSDMGKAHIAAQPCYTNQQINTIEITNANAVPLFVYYNLLGRKAELQRLAAGSSAQPILNKSSFSRIEVVLPNVEYQQQAAELLGSLDDKIELSRQMNETLEAMAQAIFRDWFVDFGPTRRKVEGASDPVEIMGGLVTDAERAQKLADLFSANFGDNGLPEGWGLVPLGHLGEVAIGGLWGHDNYDEETPIEFLCLRGVDLQHLREAGHAPKAPPRFAKRAAIDKRIPTNGDVLIASSGAGPCGRPLWVGVDGIFSAQKPVIYSNFVKRITCGSPELACYLDRILHNMRLNGEISAFISGTSVPNLNDKGLLSSKFVANPPPKILSQFLEISLLVQKKLFGSENQSLAATRDLLLPKLMSGEVRLREAEAQLEAAQ